MTGDAKTAKLFNNGQSQAVRLPKEFRFEGNEVRIRRLGNAVLLEPLVFDVKSYFQSLDDFGDDAANFMKSGREQPVMPDTEADFDS
jgi:antitoxin VapB